MDWTGLSSPEGGGQDAVTPLVGGGVEAAVELRHRDGLGVDDGGDNLELVLLGDLHVGQRGEGLGQDVVDLGLGAAPIRAQYGGQLTNEEAVLPARLPDDHDAVTHVEHGGQLADLLHEPVRVLQVVAPAQVLGRYNSVSPVSLNISSYYLLMIDDYPDYGHEVGALVAGLAGQLRVGE